MISRARRFLVRHKHAEEVAAEAVGIDIVWAVLRGLGLFGAGIAAAAVASTISTGPVHLSPGTALASYVYKTAPHYRIDPAAALAVATQEGAGGGIGDFGTSFGPWQLHAGGALPASEYHGPYSAVTQSWAWSSSGVDYALRHMGAVCHGLNAYSAVSCIVARFERSAVVARETAGAWRAYMGFHPPKPPSPAQLLRARTGYHAWIDWTLGVGPWKHHRPFAARVRPHVPRHISRLWWHRRTIYVRRHHR